MFPHLISSLKIGQTQLLVDMTVPPPPSTFLFLISNHLICTSKINITFTIRCHFLFTIFYYGTQYLYSGSKLLNNYDLFCCAHTCICTSYNKCTTMKCGAHIEVFHWKQDDINLLWFIFNILLLTCCEIRFKIHFYLFCLKKVN